MSYDDDYQNINEDKDDYQNMGDFVRSQTSPPNKVGRYFSDDDAPPSSPAPLPPAPGRLQQHRLSTSSTASSGVYSGGSCASTHSFSDSRTSLAGPRSKSPANRQVARMSVNEEDDGIDYEMPGESPPAGRMYIEPVDDGVTEDRGVYEEIPVFNAHTSGINKPLPPTPVGTGLNMQKRPLPSTPGYKTHGCDAPDEQLNTLKIQDIKGRFKPTKTQQPIRKEEPIASPTEDCEGDISSSKSAVFRHFGVAAKQTPQPNRPQHSPPVASPPSVCLKVPDSSFPFSGHQSQSSPSFLRPTSSSSTSSTSSEPAASPAWPKQSPTTKKPPPTPPSKAIHHSATDPALSPTTTTAGWKPISSPSGPVSPAQATQFQAPRTTTPSWKKSTDVVSPPAVVPPPPPMPPSGSSSWKTANTTVPPPPAPPQLPIFGGGAKQSPAAQSKFPGPAAATPSMAFPKAAPAFPGPKMSRPDVAVPPPASTTPAWKQQQQQLTSVKQQDTTSPPAAVATPPKWGQTPFSNIKTPTPAPQEKSAPVDIKKPEPVTIPWKGSGSSSAGSGVVGGGGFPKANFQNASFPSRVTPTPPHVSGPKPPVDFYEEMPAPAPLPPRFGGATNNRFGASPPSPGSHGLAGSSTQLHGRPPMRLPSYEETAPPPPPPPRDAPSFRPSSAATDHQQRRPPHSQQVLCDYVDMSVDALTAYQWYFGEIDREMSESRLSSMLSKEGAFLVRKRGKNDESSPYCLCVVCKRKVYQILIRQRPDNLYAIGRQKIDEKKFGTVPELVRFYSNNNIVLADDNRRVVLTVSPHR